jgi:hypothetical protein
MLEYRFIEYRRLKKIIMDTGSIVRKNLDMNDEINRISLIRLMEGGALMLIANAMNQMRDMVGEIDSSPLIIYSIREFNISYRLFASENKREDVNPWAIIIIITPVCPQVEFILIPRIKIAIWLTEE